MGKFRTFLGRSRSVTPLRIVGLISRIATYTNVIRSSVRNVIDKQLRYCCFLSHEQVTVVLVEVIFHRIGNSIINLVPHKADGIAFHFRLLQYETRLEQVVYLIIFIIRTAGKQCSTQQYGQCGRHQFMK